MTLKMVEMFGVIQHVPEAELDRDTTPDAVSSLTLLCREVSPLLKLICTAYKHDGSEPHKAGNGQYIVGKWFDEGGSDGFEIEEALGEPNKEVFAGVGS